MGHEVPAQNRFVIISVIFNIVLITLECYQLQHSGCQYSLNQKSIYIINQLGTCVFRIARKI